MLKSILRVFHTWDGTTDPLPERVSPGTKKRKKKTVSPTGVAEIDRLATLSPCPIQDYLIGVSAYVRRSSTLTLNVSIPKALRCLAPPSSAVPFFDTGWVPKVKSNITFSRGAAAPGYSAIVSR
jgi:hypothetical protein